MSNSQTSPTTPLAHNIPTACKRIGIGRTILYELINSGQLRAVKIGRRTLIPEDSIEALIAAAPAYKVGGSHAQ